MLKYVLSFVAIPNIFFGLAFTTAHQLIYFVGATFLKAKAH